MHKKVTIFICLIVLYSCSNKEVSFDSLVERAGIYYEVNNEKPFTGSIYKKLENNQFLLTGEFDKGFKSGEWIEYYENGQKKLVQNYSNQGKLNGIEETYNESGQLLSKGNFKNNQKNKKMRGLVVAFCMIAMGCIVSCNSNTEVVVDQEIYQCPMKCEGDKTYDKFGSCPVCNMDLKAISDQPVVADEISEESIFNLNSKWTTQN